MTSEAIVAAVQFKPKLFDVVSNIATATQLTFEAASKGAKLIVLPELCLSGYVIRSQREAADVCQTRTGYQTEAFVPIAKKFGCHIVFGYVELFGGNLYNSAAIVGPSGFVNNVQKHNLWGSDYLWAVSSELPPPVVLTAAGRTGVLICRDIKNTRKQSRLQQSNAQFYNHGSVDTVALLTNWGGDYGYPDSSWVELAEDLDANVIVSNRLGEERDMKFKGGSAVIDRGLKVWTHGSSFTEPAVVGGRVVVG